MKKIVETTGEHGILPGIGRKQIQSSSAKNGVIAVVEVSSESTYGSENVPVFSSALNMPYFTVRKILQWNLNLY